MLGLTQKDSEKILMKYHRSHSADDYCFMPSKSIYTSNNGNVVAINFVNPTLIIPVTAIAGSNFSSITAKVNAGNNFAS